MDLHDLGWNKEREEQFAKLAADGCVPARVSSFDRVGCHVLTADGEALVDIRGKMRHERKEGRDLLATGDWVALRPPTAEGARPVIESALPRTSALVRRAPGPRLEEQVLAANVDTVFLVAGLDHDFNPRRIERTLAVVAESGAHPVILLNKVDLCLESEERVKQLEAHAPGVTILRIGALHGENVEALEPYLGRGKTVVLIGSSGTGKTTLTNRLLGTSLRLTADVRTTDSHGRHTTSRRELLPLPGGASVIDTPGLREIQLWGGGQGLDETFPEIDVLAAQCKFGNCRHENEPGCAVQDGLREGKVEERRLHSFQKLQREMSGLRRDQDTVSQRALKQQERSMHRVMHKHRPKG